jgi:integrase
MASIVTRQTGKGAGLRRILFTAPDGNRREIRLGRLSMKRAEEFQRKVEAIVGDLLVGKPHEDEVSRWLRDLDSKMRRRLEKVGLAKETARRTATTLGALLDEFFASLNVKPITVTTYAQAKRSLIDHFGKDKPLQAIGALDAEKWRQWLKDHEKLAQPTISKRVKVARQVFRKAVKWKMIQENPFDEVKAGSQKNKARMRFISRDDAQKVLDACPDAQWRLLFALSRFGGLRCPSEHLGLKWGDVDWGRSRIRVTSPKTEAKEGADHRYVPLFPELLPHFREVYEGAEEGTEWIITRYRDTNCNLRTQLNRIIKRAGLTAWPKLFHNLRSTRQTELAERYPIHVVCAWLGNSGAIALDHYLQVTDAHFEQAVAEEPVAAEKATQKATRQPAARGRRGSKHPTPKMQNPPILRGNSTSCDSVQGTGTTPAGLEPATCGLEGRCSSN